MSDQYRDTFPRSIKATRRMSITEAEFNELVRFLRFGIIPDPSFDVTMFEVYDSVRSHFQWIIERVADGTILVEEPK